MKTDILDIKDIQALVDSFYEKVKRDEIIGPLFAHVNWERHLPVMYSFWENALFFTGGYTGNPLKTHRAFHERSPLNPDHFMEWQRLFISTVDELFAGEKAELAKQRALSISTVMQIKIFHGNAEINKVQ
jgi:hemoglobin